MEGEAPATDGVTEAVEPAQAETSAPEVESPTTEPEVTKAQSRQQKLANENRQFRAEVQRMKAEAEALAGAKSLDAILRANPQKAAKIMELIHAKEEAAKDPYSEFSPEVAAKFRELDAIKEWRAQQERQEKERQQRTYDSNVQSLEKEYQDVLVKEGYIKDGKAISPKAVSMMDGAVLAKLMQFSEDPRNPTKQELSTAWSEVKEGIEELKRMGLQTAVKQPGVPQTGSKGSLLPPKGKETDIERQMRIISELGG